MPLQTFRYAACGGSNTVLGLAAYWLSFHCVFEKTNFDAGFMVFTPHVAAMFVSFILSFSVGFLLNKYIVFTGSYLRGRIQIFRYSLSCFLNLVINYFLLKVFVETLHMAAFLSQFITTLIIIILGYLTQKHFTFRAVKK